MSNETIHHVSDLLLRWEFINENRKVRNQENQDSDHENKKENTLSTKKAIKKIKR